jgi:glycosyltransferase involved in cell wall biosynthesis
MPKLIRVTTVPLALKALLRGQMRYMKENGFTVLMVSADGKERENVMEHEQCPHIIVPMTRQITPVADLRCLWALYKLFRREKPDIVHSHTPKAGLLAMLAAKMAGVKIRIHTIAGLRFMTAQGMTRKILVAMEKLTGSAATHVWPNSASLLQYVRTHRLVSERKLRVIGKGASNGIDLGRFSMEALTPEKIERVKKQLAYDPQLTYLLAVGRIVKDKGICELVEVFEKLYKENESLRLVLVGDYEQHLDPLPEETIGQLKSHPGIIMAGWQDEVEYYMHLADVLVHPSYREGFPNVLLQAGALGCPIACSRIEGNIDIVDDGINGIIFAPRDAADMYEKLQAFLGDETQRRAMAEALQEKIRSSFDRRYVQEQLRLSYEALLQ